MVRHHPRRDVALAAGLSGVAGFVDAIGFIAAGGFFVSFMSGNTTRASVALIDGQWQHFGLAAGLIGAFVAGVVIGSLIASAAPTRYRRTAVLGFVVAGLTTAAALHGLTSAVVVAVLLVATAMGAENAAFERNGEVSIGLTYMTGTLVKLGQSIASALRGQPSGAGRRYFALWAALTAGAVLGSVVYRWIGFNSLWFAVGGVTVMALLDLYADRATDTLDHPAR